MAARPIIVLVGASGTGKTTLILKILERFPDHVFPIVALTTRSRRGPEDDQFYRFVDEAYIAKEKARGVLTHHFTYGGNSYATSREDLDRILAQGIGIQAFIEPAIEAMRAAGFQVLPVHIVSDQPVFRDEVREKDDLDRAKIPIDFQLTIVNSFAPGGLEKAVSELSEFIEQLRK